MLATDVEGPEFKTHFVCGNFHETFSIPPARNECSALFRAGVSEVGV